MTPRVDSDLSPSTVKIDLSHKRPILDALSLVAIIASVAIGLYLGSWLWGIFSALLLLVVAGLVFTFLHERAVRGESSRIAAHRSVRKRKWLVLGAGAVVLAAIFGWLSVSIRGM
jgi:hypothetical protein